jgi:hypothetical protein
MPDRRPTARQKRTVAERAGGRCEYCPKYTHTTALDPTTGERVSLYHPRQHRWSDHFCWSDDFLQLVGRTPIGRATVTQLQLNRPGVLNLRRLLRLVGEHPPSETPEQR